MINDRPSQQVLDSGFSLVNLSTAQQYYGGIERVVKNTIVPLYGEQSSLLGKIKIASELKCEVLLKKEEPVGFIIYKKVQEIVELYHLELMNQRDAGAGYRSQLFDRVKEIAKEHFAKAIHATLANRDPLRNYLLNRSFRQDERDPPNTRADRPATHLYRHFEFHEPEKNITADKKRAAETEGLNHKRVRVEQTRQITLPRQYIHQIKSGAKTIEGRINSGQFKFFKVGDKIRFFYNQNPTDDVTCEVTELKPYKSFPEMLTQEGYKKCVPELSTYQEACQAYDRIPNYTANALTHGVLAIHIKVVK